MMNTVPNLGGMTREELYVWACSIGFTGRISRRKAAILVGDKRPNYTTIAGDIRNYAINKYVAMGVRANGRIATALMYERICDQIYASIPKDLRW